MSYLQYSLDLLQLPSIDELTPSMLKRTFKSSVMKMHPDKGGTEEQFDSVLSAYIYLTETLNRMSGGRSALQVISGPDDIKLQRANQIINEVFDEMDRDQHSEEYQKMRMKYDAFHADFEKTHDSGLSNGYSTWLSSKEDNALVESDGIYGEHTIPPPAFSETDFLKVFESTVRIGKPEPHSIILHPDDMAYRSGTCLGVAIVEEAGGTFTSDPQANPEYTDLYSAYTSNNTLYDKLPSYQDKVKTLEELLKEREAVYETQTDEDLAAIAAYEKKKMEDEAAHKKRMQDYFSGTASSKWALEDKKEDPSSDSFVKQF